MGCVSELSPGGWVLRTGTPADLDQIATFPVAAYALVAHAATVLLTFYLP